MKDKSILLGRGLKEIKFGSNKNEVEHLLGKPDSIDTFTNNELENAGQSHIWQYDSVGLSFTFDESENFKLGMIATQSDQYLLRDVIRVGMSRQLTLDALELIAIFEFTTEDMSTIDEPDQEMIAVDEKSLYLWFVNKKLTEIQWFPYYNEEDEIIWP